MRVVFMGTPPAAVPALRELAASHEVVGVYTQPDRPRGRGRRVLPPPVKEAALELSLPVHQPRTLRAAEAQAELGELAPEAVCVVAYGKILPAPVLELPPVGCVNAHFSLLPRWRGAAPVERAILAGDDRTGVTTIVMDEGLDTGPVLMQEPEPIRPDDTAGSVTARLAVAGAGLLVRSVEGLADGTLEPRPQPEQGATYADKVEADEGELDFARPAAELERAVRAFDPHPGAFTAFGGRRLKVWGARIVPGDGPAGEVIRVPDEGPVVAAGEGALLLLRVQPEGKRPMGGDAFARGYRPAPGDRLGD